MEKKFLKFFHEVTTPESLRTFAMEVAETTTDEKRKIRGVETIVKKRGKSETFIDLIHKVIGNKHLEGCNRAEMGCLLALVKEVIEERNSIFIIDAVAKILPALYPKPNTLAQNFSTFSVAIQEAFPESKTADYARKTLHLAPEASLLRNKEYSSKIFNQHRNQRQLVDGEILEHMNVLRYKEDWVSLTLLVGLAVGSRLIEILMVSTYENTENPAYITVVGVAKDRNDPEAGVHPLQPPDTAAAGNQRKVTKPILGGILAPELIQTVEKIRTHFSLQHDVDLGFEDSKGKRKLSRKQITNLADKKVNDKIREVFGETYTFHDARSIYAQLAWVQFAPTGISQTAFFSEVLGHAEGSLTVSLSYQKFAIRRKLEEVDADLKGKVQTLDAEFKVFREQVLEKKKDLPMSQEIQTRYFLGRDGKMFGIMKQPRIRDQDEDARMARLKAAVRTLEENGVKPSFKVLGMLGYGGKIIREWSRGRPLQPRT